MPQQSIAQFPSHYTRSIRTDLSHPTDLEGVPDLSQVRILIAEDDPLNARYIRAVLEIANAPITLFRDGKDALKEAQIQDYDVLLIDEMLRPFSGSDMAHAIRTGDGPNQSSPIIAMAAKLFPQDLDRYERTGMHHLLAKPFSPIQLFAIIQKAVSTTA